MNKRRYHQAAIVLIAGAWFGYQTYTASTTDRDPLTDFVRGFLDNNEAKYSSEIREKLEHLFLFFHVYLIWLFSTLGLLLGRFQLHKHRVATLLPEISGIILAIQALATSPLPSTIAPFTERINTVLKIIHLNGGNYLWMALPAISCSYMLARDLLATARPYLVRVYSILLLCLTPWLDIGRATLLLAVALTIHGLIIYLKQHRIRNDALDFDFLAPRLGLLGSMLLAVVSLGTEADVVWFGVASVLLIGHLCLMVEVWARRSNQTQEIAIPPGEPIILDGQVAFNPFVLPNEARVRVWIALLFGAIVSIYHIQIIGASLASLVTECSGILLNTTATWLIALIPVATFFKLSQATGTLILYYDPETGQLSAPTASSPAVTFYQAALVDLLKPLLNRYQLRRAFRLYVTRGWDSPMSGFDRSGYFVEIPAGTLEQFLQHRRQGAGDASDHQFLDAEQTVRALLAHELAHIMHGDVVPLSIATAICWAAMLAWPLSGLVLLLSGRSATEVFVPIGRWGIWALMAAVAVLSFVSLLRAAQRKIELLADARAALLIGSRQALLSMFQKLQALNESGQRGPAEATKSEEVPRSLLRLGAMTTIPDATHRRKGIWGILSKLFDTHDALEYRHLTLQRGLHSLNTPDAITLAVVASMVWVPWLLADEIAETTWSPLLLSILLSVLAITAHLAEYYFLAAFCLSPKGAPELNQQTSRLWLAGMSGTLLGLGGVVGLWGWDLASGWDTSEWVAPLKMMFSNPGRFFDAPEFSEVATWQIVLSFGSIAFILLAVYVFLRLLWIKQLMRIARTLCFAFPKLPPAILILGTFLGWAIMLFLLVSIGKEWGGAALLSSWKSILKILGGSMTSAMELALTALVGTVGLMFLGAYILLEILRGRLYRNRCCSEAVGNDQWMIEVLYRGCPHCHRMPLPWLSVWTPNDPVGNLLIQNSLPIYKIAIPIGLIAVLSITTTIVGSPRGWPPERFSSREMLAQKLDIRSNRHELVHQGLRANLVHRADATIGKILFAQQCEWVFKEISNANECAKLRFNLSAALKMAPEASAINDSLKRSPGLLQRREPHFSRPLASDSEIIIATSRLAAAVVNADGQNDIQVAQVPCPKVASTSAADSLAQVICFINNGQGPEALEELARYKKFWPASEQDAVIGPLWGMAAIFAHKPSLAIVRVSHFARLCEDKSVACPGKLTAMFSELVTLATLQGIDFTTMDSKPDSLKLLALEFGNWNQHKADYLMIIKRAVPAFPEYEPTEALLRPLTFVAYLAKQNQGQPSK